MSSRASPTRANGSDYDLPAPALWLLPGGLLVAWAYGVNQVEGNEVDSVVQDFYSNIVGPFWPPERHLVEEGYRTIPFPFTELKPPVIRMLARWNLEQLLGYFSTWSATNRFTKSTGRNPLPPLAAQLEKIWRDPETPRLIHWPLTMRLGHI
jgi:hypothetical protein